MRSEVHSRALRCATMTIMVLLSAAIFGCGSDPDAFVPLAPARPLPMDGVTLEYIGREALSHYGYEEIIQLAVNAGFLRYPPAERAKAQNLVGQTLTDAARQAWPVFTRWAVTAGITSQVDSPAPGPADAVALGMLVVGLVHAGAVAAMVLTTSSDTTSTTTDAPPLPRTGRCLPCLPVPVGGIAYEYHSAEAGNEPHDGMANHTHHFQMNQSPPAAGCSCFWKRNFIEPTPDFSPLPGAVPVSPATGGGIAP